METHGENNPTISLVILLFAGIFKLLSEITIEGCYTWTFRTLTIISLMLIIIVNFNKAKGIFKRKC